MNITALQSRMARAALKWSVREAATKAQVGTNTLSRFERGGEAYISTANALQVTYEEAGVEFVDPNSASVTGGSGIRLVEGAQAHG